MDLKSNQSNFTSIGLTRVSRRTEHVALTDWFWNRGNTTYRCFGWFRQLSNGHPCIVVTAIIGYIISYRLLRTTIGSINGATSKDETTTERYRGCTSVAASKRHKLTWCPNIGGYVVFINGVQITERFVLSTLPTKKVVSFDAMFCRRTSVIYRNKTNVIPGIWFGLGISRPSGQCILQP